VDREEGSLNKVRSGRRKAVLLLVTRRKWANGEDTALSRHNTGTAFYS
jgi:hypothetical protein